MTMEFLKLQAMDEDDLAVLSTYLQDAVFKLGDMDWNAGAQAFLMLGNRFVWEKAGSEADKPKHFERRRTLLQVSRVRKVRSIGLDRSQKDQVASLLALRFTPEDAPSGLLTLFFSGGGEIQLNVECLELQLQDTGSAWSTDRLPLHAD